MPPTLFVKTALEVNDHSAQAEHDSGSGGIDLLSNEDKTRPTETQQKADTPLQSRNDISTQ